MTYSDLSNEDLAYEYLMQLPKTKAAKDREEALKAELDSRLGHGDGVVVEGVPYVWVIELGNNPQYKSAIAWVHGQVGPDVQVLLEEAVLVTKGKDRQTKSLKPA